MSNKSKNIMFKLLYSCMIFLILFLPNIGGVDYSAFPAVFLVVICILFKDKIYINKNVKLLLVVVVYRTFINLIMIFTIDTSIKNMLTTCMFELVFLGAFLVGYYIKSTKDIYIYMKILIYFLILEVIVGWIALKSNYVFKFINDNYTNRAEVYERIFNEWDKPRAIGTLGNPNYFGAIGFILVVLAILLIYYKKERTLSILALLSGIVGAKISQSDTIIIIIIFFIILSCIYFVFKKNRHLSLIILTITLFFSLMLLVKFEENISCVIVSKLEEVSNLNGRFEIWKSIKETFFSESCTIADIVFGRGIRNATLIHSWYDNYYIKILVVNGIIGLILYLIFIIRYLLTNKSVIIRFIIFCVIAMDFTAEFSNHSNIGVFIYLLLGLLVSNE